MNLQRAIVASVTIWMCAGVTVIGCSRERASSDMPPGMEARLTALETKVIELELQHSNLKSATERYQTATFDPAEKGFSRLDTPSGTFLVSVHDAKPFLDGYKLILNIGNIQSGNYPRFTIKAKWGPKFDWGKQKFTEYEKWRSSLKTKEFIMTEQLRSGAWNRVELALTPARAAEIAHVEIEMEASTVRLTQER